MGLLAEMEVERSWPDLVSYATGISVCERGLEWKSALLVFSELRRWYEPGVQGYSAAMSSCGACAEWFLALGLLEEMKEERSWPEAISYNACITACERGQHWERALRIFGELREWHKPDLVSYNAAISGCEKGSQWAHAFALLQAMDELVLEADVIISSAFLLTCVKEQRWSHAFASLEDMLDDQWARIYDLGMLLRFCEWCAHLSPLCSWNPVLDPAVQQQQALRIGGATALRPYESPRRVCLRLRRLPKVLDGIRHNYSAVPRSAQDVLDVLESFVEQRQWLKVAGGAKGHLLNAT